MKVFTLSLLFICLTMSYYIMSAGIASGDDASLVLYLTFDETGAPKDMSPNNSAIASHMEPAELVEGIEGKAWLFDDATSILLANATFEAAFQQSTFSVWLKEPGKDGIIYEEGGATKGFAVSLVNNEVQFATRDATVQTTIGADYPDDDNWHFIAAVFDAGTMRFYMDGELIDEESNVPGINAHSNDMGIGVINGGECSCGHTSKFTGTMDELRITRRALTSEEIRNTYQKISGKLSVEPSGKCHTRWGGIKETNGG